MAKEKSLDTRYNNLHRYLTEMKSMPCFILLICKLECFLFKHPYYLRYPRQIQTQLWLNTHTNTHTQRLVSLNLRSSKISSSPYHIIIIVVESSPTAKDKRKNKLTFKGLKEASVTSSCSTTALDNNMAWGRSTDHSCPNGPLWQHGLGHHFGRRWQGWRADMESLRKVWDWGAWCEVLKQSI